MTIRSKTLPLQSLQKIPYGPLAISSPAMRQCDASMWMAPRCALGMLPPTGAGVLGSASPSIRTFSEPYAASVIGFDAVPLLAICRLDVSAYVPPRTEMTVPGRARSMARWIVARGRSRVPGAAVKRR
ncbi:hypothetical protein [Nonomuraea phyllanthi]|uniref:hypothetical protein n=1 Tax=Nonomuraea phyllanthi TaxID=2219224 RepID=UPI00268A7A71